MAHAALSDFPILDQTVHGHRLVYLDNAATTQKPRSVVEAMSHYYEHDHSNVHRGVHELSRRATDLYESARKTVQRTLNAARPEEIVFTKGCTEAVNLVAASWGGKNLGPGDRILLSNMEHHANIVPWQLIAERTGASVEPIPITDEVELDLEAFESMLDERVKIVGVKHVCNATGTVNPVREVARLAHQSGAKVLIDGAQALAHEPVDVREIDADFYTVSGHKAYGPTGIGALYAKFSILDAMPPYQGGGDMIRTVSFEDGTTFNDVPNRFESGTPPIAEAVGFEAALRFFADQDPTVVREQEARLHEAMLAGMSEVPGLRVVGRAAHQARIVSFVMDCAHPHDIGTVLDQQGVAIRTGHHCCMPLMRRLGIPATARASLALYNTPRDVEALLAAIRKVREVFA